MLGYLIGASHIAGGELDPETGLWSPNPLGGERPDYQGSLVYYHRTRAVTLRESYLRWLGPESYQHSLQPMRIDSICLFSEHKQMVSRIEAMREAVGRRLLD